MQSAATGWEKYNVMTKNIKSKTSQLRNPEQSAQTKLDAQIQSCQCRLWQCGGKAMCNRTSSQKH
jgi:primase-polymerase (primpol)-like protein